PKRPPPPAAVARVVRADIAHAADDLLRRPSAQRTNIGAALAFDGFSAGERHLGADLYFTYWLAPLVGLELSVGARRGLAVSSRNGSMQATALGGAFGVLLRPLRWQHAAIAAGASLRVVGVVFRGAAVDASAALASSDTGLAVSARARAGGLFTVGRLQLRVFGGLGAPIAGVAGTDDGERVSAVSGLEIFGQLGVGFAL
ncbi:MAG: hypothetical protein KC503_32780, partial [Myxococcales bacterium]|nr:hypothetical protein [Myxococcales bacterium]